jgi:hypothetical protein
LIRKATTEAREAKGGGDNGRQEVDREAVRE